MYQEAQHSSLLSCKAARNSGVAMGVLVPKACVGQRN